jgi:hypothetical protein
MDFGKFIEKDIIEFLDEQAGKVAEKSAAMREEEFGMFEITKDFSKELDESLKNGDLKKAQSVFDEVKGKYEKAPDSSMSKKRLYIIMEELYERIKDYEAQEEGKKSLFDSLKDFEKEGLFSNPELLSKNETGISMLMSSISAKEKELESILNRPGFSLKELKDSILRYKELKALAQRIPDTRKEKREAGERTVNWYMMIKKKEKELTPPEKSKSAVPEKPIEERLAEVRKKKEEIIALSDKIKEYIKAKNIMKSVLEYKKMKKLCEDLPLELSDEKEVMMAEAREIYLRIKLLKTNANIEPKPIKNENEGPDGASGAGDDTKRSISAEQVAVLEGLKKRIFDIHNRFNSSINKQDLAGAGSELSKLQDECDRFPDEFKEEKTALLVDILGAKDRISRLDKRLSERKAAEKEAVRVDNERKESMRKKQEEIMMHVEKLKSLLMERNATEAMREYKLIKKLFESYPEASPEEKKSLYDDIISAHKDIILLEEDLKRKRSFDNAANSTKIKEIEGLLGETEALLNKDAREAAVHKLIEAKHKIQMLPKEEFDDKYRLIKELEDLEHKSLFMENMQKMNNISTQAGG